MELPPYNQPSNNDICCEFTEQNYENTKQTHKKSIEKYDPMTDYMYQEGLINRDNYFKYETHFVNIDSFNREKYPTYDLDDENILDDCSMEFVNIKNTDYIKIHYPNHPYKLTDNIILNNICGNTIKLRTSIQDPNIFYFNSGSQYLKIVYNNINNNIDNTHPLYITLSGFEGQNNMIGNIPINTLNRKHLIYSYLPNSNSGSNIDNNTIYIKLVHTFYDINPIYIFNKSYNILLTCDYINGLSCSKLNSNINQNMSHNLIYHTINHIEPDYIYINLYTKPTLYNKIMLNNISITKLLNINNGYPNTNEYSIYLDKVYNNVVSVSLVSSEFPNTNKLINHSNNMFYWETLDNKIHNIIIPNGNYTKSDLIDILENSINNKNNIIKFCINQSNNIVIIKSYQKITLYDTNIIITEMHNKILFTIYHPNHNLISGNSISISADFIKPSELELEIIKIIDKDNYTIEIDNNNLNLEIFTNSNTTTLNIIYPYKIRLRFDYENTIGLILGFSDCGRSHAITHFNHIIANTDIYDDNNICINTNHAIMCKPYNYMLLQCKQLNIITQRYNNIDNIFAKILFKGEDKKVYYNTFVNTHDKFLNNIISLYRLDFKFITYDNKLADLDNKDHSFTLKIITFRDKPKGTGLSVNSGKIN